MVAVIAFNMSRGVSTIDIFFFGDIGEPKGKKDYMSRCKTLT